MKPTRSRNRRENELMSLYPKYWAIFSVFRSPPLLVSYAFAHLDRINIGFAKLQLSADLQFSDTVYDSAQACFRRLRVVRRTGQSDAELARHAALDRPDDGDLGPAVQRHVTDRKRSRLLCPALRWGRPRPVYSRVYWSTSTAGSRPSAGLLSPHCSPLPCRWPEWLAGRCRDGFSSIYKILSG